MSLDAASMRMDIPSSATGDPDFKGLVRSHQSKLKPGLFGDIIL